MWLKLDDKRHADFFGRFEKLLKGRDVTREVLLFNGKAANLI